MARAFERGASQWGWGPDYINDVLTSEQFVALLDAAADRLKDESLHAFEDAVEAHRTGYIIARDKAANDKWRRSRKQEPSGMKGQQLEGAIMGLAIRYPEYVVREATK